MRDTLSGRREGNEASNIEDLNTNNRIKISLQDMSPKNMYETFNQYKLDENGNLQKKEDRHNSFESLDLRRDNTNNLEQVKIWALLNELWIDACCQSNTGADERSNAEAFEKEQNREILFIIANEMMVGSQNPANVFLQIAESSNIQDKTEAAKIAYRFMDNLNRSAGIDIQLSGSEQDYIDKMNEVQNEMQNSAEEPEEEIENEPVMERVYNPFGNNNNNNNGNIY
jgi:hypothetical protein